MVQRYREMADDPLRLALFRDAIAAAVRPGDVVLDAGCGLGTYAVFAARAGAGRVYAVDDGPVAEVARQVIARNGCAEIVQVLRGRTTALEPPERVDLVIFEDYVAGLLLPPVAETLADLRRRWLKPEGRLLPGRAQLWCAPLEDGNLYRSLDRFAGTRDRVLGVDLSPARRYALLEPHSVLLRPAALLADPAMVAEIDLSTIETAMFRGRARVAVRRDGLAHGLGLWFSLDLGIGMLGTGPSDPPSAWRQVVLPCDPPLAVGERESLELELEAAPFGRELVWRWRLSGSGGSVQAHNLDLVSLATAGTPPRG